MYILNCKFQETLQQQYNYLYQKQKNKKSYYHKYFI
jgi:hypothetical protein